ncbi:MAG: hypothetical protein ACYDHD_09085 [Vulcanimicrobiaceae bacterium]
MTDPPRPFRESERLAALEATGMLDAPNDPVYGSFVQLAARICEVPIALVTLIDERTQWFKANLGSLP